MQACEGGCCRTIPPKTAWYAENLKFLAGNQDRIADSVSYGSVHSFDRWYHSLSGNWKTPPLCMAKQTVPDTRFTYRQTVCVFSDPRT